MNYLITGGSGFIGRAFHQHIAPDNIVNLDLVNPDSAITSHFVKGDIRREGCLYEALNVKPVDTIISLAAMHRDFGISESEYFSTNEQGIRVICDVATQKNIKTIVFYSSVAVYGNNVGPSTEETVPRPNNPYGASKLAAERVLQKWASEQNDRKVLIIRPAVVFGIHNTANMYKLIRQINNGIYFHVGKATNIKSICYVDNLVNATLWLLKDLSPGVSVYNYADEPQLTSKEIALVISTALNKRIRLTLPKSIAIFLAFPFDLIIKITGKNLPISSTRLRKLSTETHHSAGSIFRKGFKPKVSTTEGLKIMVDWYKSIS